MRIGISLSGGGYRAAAFHLGTLRKLKQLGVLEKINVISAISGGAIIGSYYSLNADDFTRFDDSFSSLLKKSVIRSILCSFQLIRNLIIIILITSIFIYFTKSLVFTALLVFMLLLVGLIFFQRHLLPFSALKVKAYNKMFFDNKLLTDIPESPELVINSTNLETGTLFSFSRRKVGDSNYKSVVFKQESFEIAFAVACSTAVPVPFLPLSLKEKNFKNRIDFDKCKPRLVDGGLYDNQGIHKLTQNLSSYGCELIICSDGSQPFSTQFYDRNSFDILSRANDVMMRRIKNLQFIRDIYESDKRLIYFSLDWKYELCVEGFVKALKKGEKSTRLAFIHNLNQEEIDLPTSELIDLIKTKIGFEKITKDGLNDIQIARISSIRTNLTALDDSEIELLSKHSSVLLELQLNLYALDLLNQSHGN